MRKKIDRFFVIGIVVSVSLCVIPFFISAGISNMTKQPITGWGSTLFFVSSGLGFLGIVVLGIGWVGVWIGSSFTKTNETLYPTQRVVRDEPLITDKRIDALANIPNVSFHFANREEIESSYNDYFKEPTIEQVVSEIAGEISGETIAGIPKMVEAKLGGKDFSKWVSTIKIPDISTEEKFRRYQRQTIINGQVNLGLELVDIDLSELNKFEALLTEIKLSFGVIFENTDEAQKQHEILRQKAAEKTIIRLENATGQTLVEGKFHISEMNSEFYKCTYEHPVSQYLIGQKHKITISTILRKEAIEPSVAGNYAETVGKSIPLKVYGKVWRPVDRNDDVWELQITPWAVYQ